MGSENRSSRKGGTRKKRESEGEKGRGGRKEGCEEGMGKVGLKG